MAVDVIFTIASRSLRIFGSGTFSTWTVLRPDHTFALMSPPRRQFALGQRLGRALVELALGQLALGASVAAHDHASLDSLLESPELVHRLGVRHRTADLVDHLADLAARGLVLERDVDLGAAVAGRRLEPDLRVDIVEVRRVQAACPARGAAPRQRDA